MSGSATSVEMPFNDQQLYEIRQMLIDEGLYNPTTRGVINTVATGQAVVGEFTSIYNYIYSIIENSAQVSEHTKFWFSQAGAINVDYVQAPADDYIRGVTQYGLEYRKLLDGISQSDINFQLQRTSNLIGEGVINQILSEKGMPPFGKMLTSDIGAAIGNQNLPSAFQQDAGGWGGSFYFWDESFNYGSGQPNVTVGNTIMNGGAKSPQPSYDEFVYANGMALDDFILSHANFDLSSSNFGGVLATVSKDAYDYWTSLTAGSSAEAPAVAKLAIIEAAAEDLWGQIQSGNYSTGPHTPGGTSNTAAATASYSGNIIQITYANGSTATQNLGLNGSGSGLQWQLGNASTSISFSTNAQRPRRPDGDGNFRQHVWFG